MNSWGSFGGGENFQLTPEARKNSTISIAPAAEKSRGYSMEKKNDFSNEISRCKMCVNITGTWVKLLAVEFRGSLYI